MHSLCLQSCGGNGEGHADGSTPLQACQSDVELSSGDLLHKAHCHARGNVKAEEPDFSTCQRGEGFGLCTANAKLRGWLNSAKGGASLAR